MFGHFSTICGTFFGLFFINISYVATGETKYDCFCPPGDSVCPNVHFFTFYPRSVRNCSSRLITAHSDFTGVTFFDCGALAGVSRRPRSRERRTVKRPGVSTHHGNDLGLEFAHPVTGDVVVIEAQTPDIFQVVEETLGWRD